MHHPFVLPHLNNRSVCVSNGCWFKICGNHILLHSNSNDLYVFLSYFSRIKRKIHFYNLFLKSFFIYPHSNSARLNFWAEFKLIQLHFTENSSSMQLHQTQFLFLFNHTTNSYDFRINEINGFLKPLVNFLLTCLWIVFKMKFKCFARKKNEGL